MKLGPDVLIEIVSIVQGGLFAQTDISDSLRDIELSVDNDEVLHLNLDYLKRKGRVVGDGEELC